VRNREIKESL